jgi:Carboxypeptidase regulatory-like domain
MKLPYCKRLLSLAAMTAWTISAALTATAQNTGTAAITGTVTDTTGGAVPNATVLITDIDTGVIRTLTTNEAGEYTAPFLQPGHYEVVIGGGNYSQVDRKNLNLTVGQILNVDASLAAGAVTTQVEVTSESPIVDTERTEVSQTVGQQLISNLPVNGRNWSNFVLLTPNVVQDGGTGLVAFRGISALYNQNYVDGANNNQMLFSEARGRASGAPYVYSLDSIKEFQAATSNYSVEFGQAVGGQVNAITKSGTNAIHGDLFYYLRYPSFNALDPLSKYNGITQHNAFLLTQPIHQQQQFGGSIGGPIVKDRLFYFFTYDGFRRTGRVLYSNTNTITLTPTAGNSGGTIISPTQCPTTITATQCTNAIDFILGNTNGAPRRFAKSNLFFPRIDWHVNARNDAFVNFNFSDFDSTYGYSANPTFTNSSPSTNGPTSYHERFVIAGFTTQVSARSVNQVRFQWGRDLETAGANGPGPSVGMGVFTYGMPNALPRIAEPDEHRIQISNVFNTVRGHHSLKFGGDVNLVHELMINLFQGGGVYSYSGSTNAQNFASWASDVFAGQAGNTDAFQGYHYTTFVQTIDKINTEPETQGKDEFWIKMFDGFAEDAWKVRQNLTMTLGVRYDIQLTPDPGLVNNNFAPLSTYYSSTIKNVTNRVQPRIALAWEPYQGTVVRFGYGLFSGLNQGSTYYAMRVENGVVQVNYNYTGCGPASGTATTSCKTVPSSTNTLAFPNVPFTPTGPPLSDVLTPVGGTVPAVGGPAILGTQSFHGLDPNFVPPLAHEAEFGIEQAMPGKMSLSIGYVGTRALRLPVFIDANLAGQTPHGSRSYNVLNASGNLIEQLTVPVYLAGTCNAAGVCTSPSDRRDPRLQSYNTGFSVANTWYNSMAVSLRRPFADGLEVLANYTWSRATDTDQVQGAFGTFFGGNPVLDPNNIRRENGLSDIDVRNRFVGSAVYNPHLFTEKWAHIIVDGFTFAGTATASAGQPIVASMSGTVYNGGTGSYGAAGNIYGGAMSSSSGLATTGRPPQIGRNTIVGPGFFNFDFRVSRDVPIHENIKLQFTAEAFNLLNRRIITSVNSTYSTYNAVGSTACPTASQTPGPAASPLQGCIAPFTGTGTSAFASASGTNNTLYGPRQLQLIGKLFF